MSVRQKGVAELWRTVSLERSWTNIQNADCEYPVAANIREGASSRYSLLGQQFPSQTLSFDTSVQRRFLPLPKKML